MSAYRPLSFIFALLATIGLMCGTAAADQVWVGEAAAPQVRVAAMKFCSIGQVGVGNPIQSAVKPSMSWNTAVFLGLIPPPVSLLFIDNGIGPTSILL